MLLCKYCSTPIRKRNHPVAVTASESEANRIICDNCGCFCEDLYEFDTIKFREKDIEAKIVQVIKNNSYIEADEDDVVIFPEVKDVTKYEDNPIVMGLKDGTEIDIIVKAHERR